MNELIGNFFHPINFIVIYFELLLPRKCHPSIGSCPVSVEFVNSEIF